MVFRVAMIWWCLLASMARGLEPCLDDACEADSADSALSLRQLRGQQFEAQVYEHQEGMEKSPGGAEGTEDPYSKAPDADTAAAEAAAPAATEAPAETQGEGTEDTYSKPTEAETEKPAAEAPAAEEPAAEEPAAEKPAAEEPAAEEPAESEESTMTQEKWEEKQGGLCCFSGEDWHDTCGSCYPTASFKSPCASSADKCGTCGGSWCQPKCVMGAADPNNKCKTAFDTGIADGKSLCAANATSCASCKGEWCRLGVTKVAGGAGVVNSGNSAVASSTAAAATGGFCCYRGKAFAPDMCGACADVSQDIACANSKGCGSCGGTWCAGPRCVKAFSDKKNPCGSAFKGNVAPLSDYCAGSELRCSDCGGAWCSASNITYDDGVKFNPDGEEASSSESDSADSTDSADDDFPDDEGDIQPEGYEPLTDLLPGGLAKKA